MEGLNEFEKAVLEKLLAGEHPVLVVLRTQAQAALASCEYTGVGFFCSFTLPSGVPILATQRDFHFGDVNAVVEGLHYGAGFVLFVRSGRLDTLEGYSYEEPWPKEVRGFKLTYQREPRGLELPDA